MTRNRAMTNDYWDTADEMSSLGTEAAVDKVLTQALQMDYNVKLPLCRCPFLDENTGGANRIELMLYKDHSDQLRSIWRGNLFIF
jgi:hypothetical protein